MPGKSTHLCTCYPSAKHSNHSKFAIIDMREKTSGLFSLCVDFSSRNIFVNLVSFTEVSVPVETIIP